MENEKKMNLLPVLIFGGIILIYMLGLTTWGWFQVPEGEKIPVHWGIGGEVDRYGSKWEGLGLIPIVTLFFLLLFYFIPYLEPRKFHFIRSEKAYKSIIVGLLIFLAVIHTCLVLAAVGFQVDVGQIVSLLVGGLFIVVGNVLGKIRSNFLMGIRTPWTLSSELSWRKTHRLGGWLFVGLGFVIILTALLLPQEFFFWVIIIGTVGITLFSMGYSYWVWRNDPNRNANSKSEA